MACVGHSRNLRAKAGGLLQVHGLHSPKSPRAIQGMFKETPSKWSGVLFALKLQYFLEKKINVKESSLLKLAKLFFSKGSSQPVSP